MPIYQQLILRLAEVKVVPKYSAMDTKLTNTSHVLILGGQLGFNRSTSD
jgi:hypothetical protein